MNERSRPQPPRMLTWILPAVLLILYVPLIVMCISSFFEPMHNAGSSAWTLRWYEEVFSDPILIPSLGRSLIVATTSATLATLLGMIGALALDKWLFSARRPLGLYR